MYFQRNLCAIFAFPHRKACSLPSLILSRPRYLCPSTCATPYVCFARLCRGALPHPVRVSLNGQKYVQLGLKSGVRRCCMFPNILRVKKIASQILNEPLLGVLPTVLCAMCYDLPGEGGRERVPLRQPHPPAVRGRQ